jgi:hypothetical protein
MNRSKGRIRQDLLSVINNTGTVKQCRMSEVTGFFLTKNVKEICWDLKFLSEVTGSGVPGENHRSILNHWQILSHNIVSSTPRHERVSNSQHQWWWAMIAHIVTTIRSRSRSWRGVLDTILCDKICQWFKIDRWFSPGTPVSSTNKTDFYDITEILLKKSNQTYNSMQLNVLWSQKVQSIYEINSWCWIWYQICIVK